MAINFASSKDSDEIQTMHTKINNVEIMMGNEVQMKLSSTFLNLFLKKYQKALEESMRKKIIYDNVDVLYYNLNKVSLSKGGSYTDSAKWLKKQKGNDKSEK